MRGVIKLFWFVICPASNVCPFFLRAVRAVSNLLALFGRLRLYLFGLFIYLHTHRTVPARWRMVNARLCKTARLAFFFASPRHFDFLDCETETLKCFECECETFRLSKFESQILLRTMRMSYYELVQKSYNGAFCCKPKTSDKQQSINSTVNKL